MNYLKIAKAIPYRNITTHDIVICSQQAFVCRDILRRQIFHDAS